jgi:NDP-sugar pyrophosphorylase family protein
VRHGAYVRSNALVSRGCVVGHATEVKNSILLPGAHAPHFNYVGDSILGRKVNLGAGTKLSNLTVVSVKDPATGKRPTLKITVAGEVFDTGLAKLGAILGDGAQTGCNSVLNPGVLIGPRSLVYANASLPKGYYPGDTIIKLRQTFEYAERR